MPSQFRSVCRRGRAGVWLAVMTLLVALCPGLASCGGAEAPLAPRSQTWAELRTIRRAITVVPPGEAERAPYPRERLVDGEVVQVSPEGLAWLRRDGGATLLVRGPAKLTMRAETIEVSEGRVFIDTPKGVATELSTPSGPLHLAHVRASIDVGVGGDGAAQVEAYVLAGEVRTDGASRATAGERLVIRGKPGATQARTSPALTWEDWTGGLATTDRAAEPAPYGIGTVGARRAGDQGAPRAALAIQRLDVRVTVQNDFAVTEVDEIFFNPSSEVMEGVYRFRTPEGATLHRFGVDREGVIVWGRVKEKQAAAAQYQANVYQGSTEDPALLEWDAPGVYRARLYPIGPGESRRVVVRYAEWLGRTGAKGERRLYVYPMAAEGAEESLPHIEELTARIDFEKAGAKEVRVGMTGVREGNTIVIREHDLIPRADLAVELFDDGLAGPRGYRARHVVDEESLPANERAEARRVASQEADYVLFPLRAGDVPKVAGGLDLAIVIDTSAATDAASLSLARAATGAMLAHLGKDDRAVVWAGDDQLRPVLADRAALQRIDEPGRRAILTALATAPRGGATDLGSMLGQAAAALDPARRGAVVYIGDGSPTVGELSLTDLRDRLAKLPRPVRIFSLGIGDRADMAVLKGLARGAFAERIGDANEAARAALRLLEQAERPALLGTSVDLGPSMERVFPRDLGAMVADESLVVIGRLTSGGAPPTSVSITGPTGVVRHPVEVTSLEDAGDLRRRWAEGRLGQLIDEGTGRAAMVDLGSRHGIITPVTSLYVPTKKEMTPEERYALERAKQENQALVERKLRFFNAIEKDSDGDRSITAASVSDDKEGGTGARAKGEEGSMGNPRSLITGSRYGITGPADAPSMTPPAEAMATAAAPASPAPSQAPTTVSETKPSGDSSKTRSLDGNLANNDDFRRSDPAVAASAAPTPLDEKNQHAWGAEASSPWSDNTPELARQSALRDAAEFGMVGLLGGDGTGEGGGGRGDGIPLGAIGTLGKGAGTGTGQGFGSGHGRLGGSHRSSPPQVRMGAVNVNGRLPPEVIQRIVRQNFGRFRLCYESGLQVNPNLQGRVAVRFVIGKDGSTTNVGNGGSDLPDGGVVSCIVRAFHGLSFPQPDGGVVSVVYPIMLSPGGGSDDSAADRADRAKTIEPSKVQITVQTGDVPHVANRCGGAAYVPLDERIQLWRERLGRAGGNPQGVVNVYRYALQTCEAPTWRERSRLLSMLLDAMPSVSGRVALWKMMFQDLGAADALYRGMLARVRTPQDMRDLNAALGLRSADPGLVAKMLKEAKSPEERTQKLRALVVLWPNDFVLGLQLLGALEDAGDLSGAREQGKKLRDRPDADARVRTAVGELNLRLAQSAKTPAEKAEDEAEARRAFGEIVEFAPDDPVARRRLGDLLRAHGWFLEAARQYETLARLAPDDSSVALLLAAAAEGQGKLEEAVRWTEKGGAAGAPDAEQSPARTARAFAATYLAWGRLSARDAGKKDEVETLLTRSVRVLAADLGARGDTKSTRVALTWSHPELHPTLWSNALGAPMPAPEGDITLGIAQVRLPEREGVFVEVRLEPDEVEHAARLGLAAVLTVVWSETEEGERILRRPITFARGGPATQRILIGKGEVKP